MSDNSAIEWTDATWNPVTGCTKVSRGCDNCYAETFAERWRGTPGHYFEQGFDVVLRPDKLTLPLKWRKPRRVFVNSMSDLFHDDIPDDYIAQVFAVMAATPLHTYQLLTKRHGRMRSLLSSDPFRDLLRLAVRRLVEDNGWTVSATWLINDPQKWPLPNVWLGVSVEDQKRADLRIPALLDTPAAVRWLSCEPLLGPVDLTELLTASCTACGGVGEQWVTGSSSVPCHCAGGVERAIDWVVVGGESGLRARPMQVAWARALRDQVTAAAIPFFFKQWGGRTPKANGRELDGRTWDEYPAAALDGAR